MLFQHNVPPDIPPASLSSSSASIDPAALELKSAFTSAHVVYLYHRGQNGLRQVVAAAAADHQVVAVVAGTVPDDGRDKIYALNPRIVVVVVQISHDRSQICQMDPFPFLVLILHRILSINLVVRHLAVYHSYH